MAGPGGIEADHFIVRDDLLTHHAFMNHKIMPKSATRFVTGVGRPARKYQSLPRWVRMPGVSVTLVWSPYR